MNETLKIVVLQHRVFHYREHEIIEKLIIRAPFRYIRPFRESACFLHLKEGNALLYDSDGKLTFQNRESVLLRCGTYFGDLLQQVETTDCAVYAVHLYPELLSEIYGDALPEFLKSGASTPAATGKIAASSVIDQYIESLEFYFQHPGIVTDELLQLKLKELIILLMQTEKADTISDLLTGLFSPKTTTIREIVETHLYSNLNIEELAALCHMSLSSFKRDFKNIYNQSPAAWLRNKRLEKARELLLLKDASVSDVAWRVGFRDLAHFSKSYRQQFGQNPSDTIREQSN